MPIETATELEYCARYRLFLVLLKEISKPKPPIEHAFLSFFLADLSVKPQHRVIAIRMAIRHNLLSSNFGVAANLIQVCIFCIFFYIYFTNEIQFLIDRIHPVDENVLQEKLRKCMAAGKNNTDKRFKSCIFITF